MTKLPTDLLHELTERLWIRVPLMMLGMLALVAGLWAGIVRIGWELPQGSLTMLHGPLMVCGFLGTVISLERAVALGRLWSYGAPLLSGAGGILLIAQGIGLPVAPSAGALFLAVGSLVLVIVFTALLRIQAQAFVYVMGGGALAWLVGNVLWLAAVPLTTAVWWWMGFLVLTIAGERLELARILMHAPTVQRTFLLLVWIFAAGLVWASFVPASGLRVIGAALVLLAGWLLRYDIARRTVRQHGLTRFIAFCLIAGYVWLIAGGLLLLIFGFLPGALLYDAALHAVFVGFVFSMIFGHAPIIFPSVLRVPVAYRPVYYVHLSLLHASLAVRVAGDLAGVPALRRGAGMANAAAILLFLGVTVVSVAVEKGRLRREGKGIAPSPDAHAVGARR